MSLILAAIATFTLAQSPDSILSDPVFPEDAVIQEAPAWQRFVPVAASLIVPGTGQMLQGEWGKGWLHLGVSSLCLAAIQIGSGRKDFNYQFIGGVGAIAIGLWSPWEAFEREKRLHEEGPK